VDVSIDPEDLILGSGGPRDSGNHEAIMAATDDGNVVELDRAASHSLPDRHVGYEQVVELVAAQPPAPAFESEQAAKPGGTMSTVTDTQALEIVWTLTSRMVAARSLQVVADLGVADHIGGEPVTAVELAASCGAEPGALDRVLRLLAAGGIFAHEAAGYRHTDASQLLRSDHPTSMRALTRLYGLPVITSSLEHLDYSVRSGQPAVEVVEPNGFFAYLQGHPDEAAVFDEAMTVKARADVAAVLGAYDFQRFPTIADIGGGRGHLIRAVLDAVPGTQGILFDLPRVIESQSLAREQLRAHAGDFFIDPLPTADAYLLMEVIHDWPDAEAATILRAVRRAASPGATVLIIEGIVPDGHADPRVHTLDVLMLTVSGGRERTVSELGELLSSAGFRLSRVFETASPMWIIEAAAV
jgi:C-methyltransferase